MSIAIPPYLQGYLDTANALPEQFPDVPVEAVEALQERLRTLVRFAAHLDAQVLRLTQALEEASDE